MTAPQSAGRMVPNLQEAPLFMVHRSSLIVMLAAVLLLSACGLRLRGDASMPFDSIYVQAPVTSPLTTQLKRAVASGSKAQVLDTPDKADVILHITDERQEKEILTLSGGGRVSEFQLRYRVSFRLTDNKRAKEYIPLSEIVLQRPLTYRDQDALSKQSEEALLYRDMRQDAVQQLLRRLQAASLQASS
jgi:LPS-assembly lipoprotein